MYQHQSIAHMRAETILHMVDNGLITPAQASAKLKREGLTAIDRKGRVHRVMEDLTGRTFTITV